MKKQAIIVLAIFVAAVLIGTAAFFTVKNAAAKNAYQKAEKTVKQEEHITSAVDFLNKTDVIIPASELPESLQKGGIDRIIEYKGKKYYYGFTANPIAERAAMLILTEEQSREILTAPDIAEISYYQSECLTLMVRWSRKYTDYYQTDVNKNMVDVRKTVYYYFDDRTVVVANDFCGIGPVDGTGARIEVIANDSNPGFLIPEEGAEKAEQGTYYDSYFEYIVKLENRLGGYQTDNP
ncbi:MAG: hypothetical protein K6B54_01570 [Clostridia bacterium]|nr:hypothetical protein [Clostridia bacterium]